MISIILLNKYTVNKIVQITRSFGPLLIKDITTQNIRTIIQLSAGQKHQEIIQCCNTR